MEKQKNGADFYRKRKNPRLQGYDYSLPGAYFITLCTQDRKCLLSTVPVGTGVPDCPSAEGGTVKNELPIVSLKPYGKIVQEIIEQLDSFYDSLAIEHYVIMPNHVHLLIVCSHECRGQSRTPVPTSRNSTLSVFVSTLKRFCNKEIGKNIWQNRYYDHIVRNEDEYRQIAEYIAENPFKWELDQLYSNE